MREQDWIGSPHEDGRSFGPGDGPGVPHPHAQRGEPVLHLIDISEVKTLQSYLRDWHWYQRNPNSQ